MRDIKHVEVHQQLGFAVPLPHVLCLHRLCQFCRRRRLPGALIAVAHPLPEDMQQVMVEVGGALLLGDEGQPVLAAGLAECRNIGQRQPPVHDGGAVILLARPFFHLLACQLQPAGLRAVAVALIDLGKNRGIDSPGLGSGLLGTQGLQFYYIGEETVGSPLLM